MFKYTYIHTHIHVKCTHTYIYAYTHIYNHTAEIQNKNIPKVKIQQITTASSPLHSPLGFSEISTKFHMLLRKLLSSQCAFMKLKL